MVTLFRNVRKMSIGGVYCTIRVRGDGERIYVTVGPAAGARIYTVPPSMTITYSGESVAVNEARDDVTVEFTYTGEKSIGISDANVWLDGVMYTDGYTFTWDNEVSSVRYVDISYSIDKIRYISASTVSLEVISPGHVARIVEMSVIYEDSTGYTESQHCDLIDLGDGKYKFENKMSDVIAKVGTRITYRIEAASYADAESANIDGGERFVGFGEVFTPSYIISGGQSTPYGLLVSVPIAGCDTRVSFEALSDAKTFTLERSVDGGGWSQIYVGTAKEYLDKVPSDAKRIKYRVSSSGSPKWESDEILVRRSNIYIGTSTGILAVAELYLGRDGRISSVPPIMTVG